MAVAEIVAVDRAGVTLGGSVHAGDILVVLGPDGAELARLRVLVAGPAEARAEVARGSVVGVGDPVVPTSNGWGPPGERGPDTTRVEVRVDVAGGKGQTVGVGADAELYAKIAPLTYVRVRTPLTFAANGPADVTAALATSAAVGLDGGGVAAEVRLGWGCYADSLERLCVGLSGPTVGVGLRAGWRDGLHLDAHVTTTTVPFAPASMGIAAQVPLSTRLDLYGSAEFPFGSAAITDRTNVAEGGLQAWVIGWGGPGSLAARVGIGLQAVDGINPVAELGAAARW